VWISNPVPLSNDEFMVVVDSEGTEMGDTKYQYKILALACLLACNGGIFVHNEKHYSHSSISPLAVVAKTMELLKGLEKEQFPYLCFLVRDFEYEVTVNGVPSTLDEFFRSMLANTGDAQLDSQRQVFHSPHPLPFGF
jgi:hypothetical protein